MKGFALVTAGLLGLLGVAAIVLALRAGGAGEPVAMPSAGSTPGPAVVPVEAPVPALATCRNADLGYLLAYPAEWVVATDDRERLCRFFSSTAIGAAPPGSEFPVAEIRVLQAQVPYDELLDQLAASVFEEVSRTPTTVAGADAVLIRYEHPDDPGVGGYVCVIDRGTGPALYVEARETDSADIDATARVLDAMVRSMEPA